MTVESGQVGETGEVTQTAELSLREELAKNLADLTSDKVVNDANKVDNVSDKVDKTTVDTTQAAESTESKVAPTEATPAEQKAKAPQSWSATEKAHWDKIPAEVQAVIARREEEAHRGITALGQQSLSPDDPRRRRR
jgi:hypothetical protein